MIYEINSEDEIYDNKFQQQQNLQHSGFHQAAQNQGASNDYNKDINLNDQNNHLQVNNNDEKQQKIILEKDLKLLSVKNILGKVSFLRWRRRKNFFFSLDMQRGRILCYKQVDSKKASTYYTIIKGQFKDDSETQQSPQTIKVQSKRGKLFTLKLNEDKDPQSVREYLQYCIDKNVPIEDLENQYKGYFVMLGKGLASIFKIPFRLTNGILVNDFQPQQKKNAIPLVPNKIFTEEKQQSRRENFISVSGMFFGTSQIVKEILGSIAVLHGNYQDNGSCFSLSQEIMTGDQQFAVGLIFKPILGTIDMVVIKMSNGDFLLEREIYENLFKIKRIRKKKRKLKKKQIQAEKEKQELEITLGIDDTKMEQVQSNDTEILFLRKDNGILHKQDIDKMHKWGQVIHLGDIDNTLKRPEEENQLEQEITNEMLDFYKKSRLKHGHNAIEEESCEFLVVYPVPQEKIEEDDLIIKEQEEYFGDQMEEHIGEDTVVNMERYQERYEQKCLPRIGIVPGQHGNHMKVNGTNQPGNQRKVNNGQMPSFLVQQSPFSKERLQDDSEDEQKKENSPPTSPSRFKKPQSPKQGQMQEDLVVYPAQQQDNQEEVKSGQKQSQPQEHQSGNKVPETPVVEEELKKESSPKASPQKNGQNKNLDIPQTNNNNADQASQNEEDESSSGEEFGEGDDAIVNANSDYEHARMKKSEIEKWVQNFQFLPVQGEDRIADAHAKGGKVCNNKEIISTMRGVGKFILNQIGRKILSGNFNLTTVSFPIKAMIPKSALYTILYGTVLFPYYINLAVKTNDLVQRFKYLITASLGNFPVANGFLKPLNPILGETFEGSYPDGTKLYAEQTSHHPPVSSFLTIGPNKSYTFYGYYLYDANAGLNSLTLKNKGKRRIIFHGDNQIIDYDYGYESYTGTFWGTMKHETLGSIEFIDKKNNIKAVITLGKTKKKPTDYFSGEITVNGNVVSKCTGSYNGFIDFDGVRYWDFKKIKPFRINVDDSGLQSDHSKRQDRVQLAKGHINKAQKEKENLENLQRKDKKLRKAFEEKRQKEIKKQKKQK